VVQAHDFRPGLKIIVGTLKDLPKRRVGMPQPVFGIVKCNKNGGGALKRCDTLNKTIQQATLL
jgi:hypothetical protein